MGTLFWQLLTNSHAWAFASGVAASGTIVSVYKVVAKSVSDAATAAHLPTTVAQMKADEAAAEHASAYLTSLRNLL